MEEQTASNRPNIRPAATAARGAAKEGFAIVREIATSKYFLRYIVLVVVLAVFVIFYLKNKA